MYRLFLLLTISLYASIAAGQEKQFVGNWIYCGGYEIYHFNIKKNNQVIGHSGNCTDPGYALKGNWITESDTLILTFDEGIFRYLLKDEMLNSVSRNYINLQKTHVKSLKGAFKACRKERKKAHQKMLEEKDPDPSKTIQTGVYRQYETEGDSSWYADLKVLPDHTFSFNDTRIRNYFCCSEYIGKWTISNDTLTLVWEQDLQLLQRQFIVSENKIMYIEPTETNRYLNWGDFSFFTSELSEDLE